MKKLIPFILILTFLISLCGCAAENTASGIDNDKKIIAVSIVPEATFAQKVCGDNFEIVTMIPPGASAETYEPTPAEMQKLQKAEVYFAIGVPSEENSILPSLSKETKTVELHTESEKIYPALKIDGGRDPHLWLSPKRVKIMVTAIAEALSEADPENKELYTANAEKYCHELTDLDDEITQLLKDKQNRKFIAYHPAFGYFADDYSLTQYALEEHGKEADAKHMTEIIDLAKTEDIKVIFYQAEISGRQAAAFAEEIGGTAVCLEPLAADYTENLRKMAKTLAEAMN